MNESRQGIFLPLEQAADELIFGSLAGVTSQAEKKDILTPWKEMDRRRKEVMAVSGTVDPAVRRGMYHRAANMAKPYLNSRDGHYPASRKMDGSSSYSSAPRADDGDDED
jgi:hypothetical protein